MGESGLGCQAERGAKPTTAAFLIIGDEILSGRTRDANLPFLAARLNECGVRLREVRVVADREAEIISAVNALRARYDYVFTSGGIGPTHDDVTSASVAKAFGTVLERRDEAVRLLERRYERDQLNDARLRMADVPVGSSLIDNPVSFAPGFCIENVHVLAGVPAIFEGMFESLAPSLAGGRPIVSRSLSCFVPEGTLADGLRALQEKHPDVSIGSYPHVRGGRLGVVVVSRHEEPGRADAVADAVAALMIAHGGEPLDEEAGLGVAKTTG